MTTLNITCPSCGLVQDADVQTDHLQDHLDEECRVFPCAGPEDTCGKEIVVRVVAKHEVYVTAPSWVREPHP